MKKIIIFSETYLNEFSAFLKECLEHKKYNVSIIHSINNIEKCDFFIYFNYLYKENFDIELKSILEKICDSTKIIFIENSLDIYLNSEMKQPFSTFKILKPKNEISRKIIDIETLIKNRENYTIFRVSELYGKYIKFGLIWNILHHKTTIIDKDTRDFLYDGDLIHALEVAIESNSTGIYDIASGIKVKTDKNFIDLINCYKKCQLKNSRKKKIKKYIYNCENFKFYKWEPLVQLQTGLNTMINKKEQ